MRRAHLIAFVLAALPALVVAAADEKRPSDRLTLEDFLEMESVSDPQLSPDGTPHHLHARVGRQDGRLPRIGALDHERRRLAQPVPRERIQRPLVAVG